MRSFKFFYVLSIAFAMLASPVSASTGHPDASYSKMFDSYYSVVYLHAFDVGVDRQSVLIAQIADAKVKTYLPYRLRDIETFLTNANYTAGLSKPFNGGFKDRPGW